MSLLALGPQPAVTIKEGVFLLPGRAPESLLEIVEPLLMAVPPRKMVTAWGKPMSVAITNWGALGWVSGRGGYAYAAMDPVRGTAWPPIPTEVADLARSVAAEVGFAGFVPDACLVNLYGPEARMGLHQDRDERDFDQPIVSISLGRAARFRFGTDRRGGPTRSILLEDRDVLVFGGAARLMFHGVERLAGPAHSRLGEGRINLTLRRAG
jgi:alkylated DNA repair protein (DNA oxidative demethylase)